jgi:hypothetical protein
MKDKKQKREEMAAIGTLILISTILLLTIVAVLYEISTK